MNITERISLLDELRDKARGEHGWKVDGDESPYAAIKEVDGVRITTNDYGTGVGMDMEDAEYIVALHNNYEALRQAALDGERYRKAGEVLLESIKEHSCDGQEDCWVAMETYANTYHQTVEEK